MPPPVDPRARVVTESELAAINQTVVAQAAEITKLRRTVALLASVAVGRLGLDVGPDASASLAAHLKYVDPDLPRLGVEVVQEIESQGLSIPELGDNGGPLDP